METAKIQNVDLAFKATVSDNLANDDKLRWILLSPEQKAQILADQSK